MRHGVYSTLFLLLFWFAVLFSVGGTFIKSRYACQGQKLRIRCKSSRIIRIFSANYGRTEPGSSICPSLNISSTTCESSKALDIVIKKCMNRARCNIKADTTMFPDPCPNTFKYLDVIYGCVSRPPNMTEPTPSKRKQRRRTTPRYQATTTAEWISELETTDQPTTTARTTPTEHSITTTPRTNLTTLTTTALASTIAVTRGKTGPSPTKTQSTTQPPPKDAKSGYLQRGEREFLFNLVVFLYLTYVILTGQPKYVLILFLSGVAIATVLLLVLLLGLHLKGRRTKKFVVQQDKRLKPNNEDDEDEIDNGDDSDSDEDEDENKNVTIEIQGGDDEEKKQISVKPGDIIIIDSKEVDNDDSEDLGYMSEIVRYYNSRNMVQEDGKQSSTCETPSVNSIPNSEIGEKRETQYDNMPKANGTCVT